MLLSLERLRAERPPIIELSEILLNEPVLRALLEVLFIGGAAVEAREGVLALGVAVFGVSDAERDGGGGDHRRGNVGRRAACVNGSERSAGGRETECESS